MKLLLLILIPFYSFNQIKIGETIIPDDALHFYGIVAVGEVSHGVQTLIYKERTLAKKLFIDWLISQAVIFGKEVYDCYKENPTGFSGEDIAPGQLGAHTRLMVKISIDDFINHKSRPRKISNKKYILD